MPKIKYKDIVIREKGLAKIKQVNAIIDEYQAQGYSLSLRQVYYQLVSKNIIENSEKEYKNLGNLINDGRLVGLIDWNAIEDRTRNLRKNSHWGSPADIIRAAAESYHINLWETQPYYLECWIEKDALIGIAEQAARIEYDVSCFSCRGYGSSTELWNAARRIIGNNAKGKPAVILHLGDHDPSGIDMTRDIEARLSLFGADVEIKRIALNMLQIEEHKPPPNPAKITDTRADKYISQYGRNSWELDALEPRILDELIKSHISNYLDINEFEQARSKQEREREQLLKLCV